MSLQLVNNLQMACFFWCWYRGGSRAQSHQLLFDFFHLSKSTTRLLPKHLMLHKTILNLFRTKRHVFFIVQLSLPLCSIPLLFFHQWHTMLFGMCCHAFIFFADNNGDQHKENNHHCNNQTSLPWGEPFRKACIWHVSNMPGVATIVARWWWAIGGRWRQILTRLVVLLLLRCCFHCFVLLNTQ